jgi:hypothetical protein
VQGPLSAARWTRRLCPGTWQRAASRKAKGAELWGGRGAGYGKDLATDGRMQPTYCLGDTSLPFTLVANTSFTPTSPCPALLPFLYIVRSYFSNFRPDACRALPGIRRIRFLWDCWMRITIMFGCIEGLCNHQEPRLEEIVHHLLQGAL